MDNKEITIGDLYELILKFQNNTEKELKKIRTDLTQVKQTVETTREHVARIDERLTQTKKIAKLFNPEIIEKITS